MWVQSFIEYLKFERNYSARTVKVYEDDLRAFESYFRKKDSMLNWNTVDTDIVRDWMVFLMDAGQAATSVNRRLSTLRSYYKFLLMRGWITEDPVRNIQGPKKKKALPAFLKESEINALLDGCYFGDDFFGKRDRLIIDMFYSTGIRLSELTGLDEGDVDFYGGVLKVTGKRNKQRIVPFGKELRGLLETYIAQKHILFDGKSVDPALFVDDKGERMKNIVVWRLVRHYLGMVTTQYKKSPHVLRHTFATSMLNHDADLEVLKELLGHESISTTEIYTHTTFEELKEMYNKAHPRA